MPCKPAYAAFHFTKPPRSRQRNRQTDIDGELDFFQRSTYDNLDRVVKVERFNTTASGQLVARNETKFDDRGRVYQTVTYRVDPATGTVAGNQTWDMTYDHANNLLRKEPAGSMKFQEFEFDSIGRRTAVIDPLGHARQFAYDNASNQVSQADPNNEVWTRVYDPLGRTFRTTNPLDESTTLGFNSAGRQTTVSNALSETTTTMFDAAGRVVSISDPLS